VSRFDGRGEEREFESVAFLLCPPARRLEVAGSNDAGESAKLPAGFSSIFD